MLWSTGICTVTSPAFFFGIATAPAHVEDDLNDTWLEFARGHDDHYPVIQWPCLLVWRPNPATGFRVWLLKISTSLECRGDLSRLVYMIRMWPFQRPEWSRVDCLSLVVWHAGQVRAWQNVPVPEKRLRFWTKPEIELDLAKETGITVFRLGIDWGRLVPEEPTNGTEQVVQFFPSKITVCNRIGLSRWNMKYSVLKFYCFMIFF